MLFQKFRAASLAVALFLATASSLVSAAHIETADGQRLEGTATFAQDGKIAIKTANSEQRSFTWDQVRVASLNKSVAQLKPLPRGWRVEDIGKVMGSASDHNGVFAFAVKGGESKEKKYQPLHFAYRVVRGEPEVVARITSARGPLPALGGVMLRENMEAPGGYALLGVSGDKHLRFESRPGGWNSVKSQDFGVVKLPIWLKIARLEKDNGVQAFRSSDGTNWSPIVQAKLNCHNSPFPENSDHWMPRVYAGVGITAPAAGAEAAFQCDNVAISCRGLLGEYFAENDFKKLAFARADKKVEFWWGDRSPAPMLEPEKFSVRWQGKLEARYSEPYRFYCDPGTRLILDGTEIDCFRWDEPKKQRADLPKEIPLVAGRKYDLQFEFSKTGREVKATRLGWSSRGQQREHISSTAVSYLFDANTPGEEFESATNNFIPAGLWLRSGSFIAGEITASDRSATQVAFAGDKPMTVLNHRVARLILRPTRQPIRFDLAAERTGTFLQNGDFMESELDEVTERSVIVSSVLFGRRTYSRDNSQPLAVVMNALSTQSRALSVKLLDGSVLNARKVRSEANAIVIDEVLLGDLRVPAAHVQEIQNTAIMQRASAK